MHFHQRIQPESFFGEREIHIHVPAGAVPKDGPSAGVTVACALVSLLTNTPVRGTVAMTGEITLRGRVLPVGGLKEKLLAALRAGIQTVLVPEANRRDLEEIPRPMLRGLHIVLVRDMDDVLREALVAPLSKAGVKARPEAVSDARQKAAEDPPTETRSGARAVSRASTRASTKADGRAGAKADTKADTRAGAKADTIERASRNGPGRFLKA